MEEKPKEEKPEGEEAKPTEVIEERPEFTDAIKMFMTRTGQSREQAATWLWNLFNRMNIDPERNIEAATRAANKMIGLLEMFPESQFKQAAMEAVGTKALYDATTKPDPAARATKMMESLAPYMMMAPAMREMARAMSGGGDNNPQVAKLEEKLASVEEKLKEKPIEELKSTVQSLREEIAALKAGPKEDSEGKMVGAVEELRKEIAKMKETEREDRVISGLKALEERLAKIAEAPPKERKLMIQEMADEVQGTTSGLRALKDSLVDLGVVKEEEVTTKTGRINWGALANKALKVVEEGVKSMRAKTPPRVTVETQPVPQPLPPAEVKVEEPVEKPPEPEPEKPPEEAQPEPAEEKPSEAPQEKKGSEEKPAEEVKKEKKSEVETDSTTYSPDPDYSTTYSTDEKPPAE